MKLFPVKNYKARYPDRYQANLKNLLTHKPKNRKELGTAMLIIGALASTGLSGCRNDPELIMGDVAQDIRKMNMAPLFEAAPAFYTGSDNLIPLSEESAMAIIQDELAKQGLSADTSQYKVIVESEPSYPEWSFDMGIRGTKTQVYAEFLPQIDAESPEELAERESLDLPENAKEAAVELETKLSNTYDNSTGAIFYANDTVSLQEQDLRAQVVEFVQWLKSLGLI